MVERHLSVVVLHHEQHALVGQELRYAQHRGVAKSALPRFQRFAAQPQRPGNTRAEIAFRTLRLQPAGDRAQADRFDAGAQGRRSAGCGLCGKSGRTGEKGEDRQGGATHAASLRSGCPLFYGLGRVFLGDLVVEEAGRVGGRHEAAIHLGVDADVLGDLAVRHLDFQRTALLVVADRAQLRGIDALSLHQAFSTRTLSPVLIFLKKSKSENLPSTLQGFASFGRSSLESGVRPKGRASESPSVQKQSVTGSTTWRAFFSSFALTGVVK